MKWIKLWENFKSGDTLDVIGDILVELNQSDHFEVDYFQSVGSINNTITVIIDLKADYNKGDDVYSISDELYNDVILRMFHYMGDWRWTIIVANDDVPPGADPGEYERPLQLEDLRGCNLCGEDFIRIDFFKKIGLDGKKDNR
jgi:hypothetical protein